MFMSKPAATANAAYKPAIRICGRLNSDKRVDAAFEAVADLVALVVLAELVVLAVAFATGFLDFDVVALVVFAADLTGVFFLVVLVFALVVVVDLAMRPV